MCDKLVYESVVECRQGCGGNQHQALLRPTMLLCRGDSFHHKPWKVPCSASFSLKFGLFCNVTGIRVAVDTFKKGLGVLDVKIGGNAVSYDHPETGWTWVLNYPRTLRIDGMPSHLAN
jgi:hypothetical protein